MLVSPGVSLIAALMTTKVFDQWVERRQTVWKTAEEAFALCQTWSENLEIARTDERFAK
jgi:hypothetical protein